MSARARNSLSFKPAISSSGVLSSGCSSVSEQIDWSGPVLDASVGLSICSDGLSEPPDANSVSVSWELAEVFTLWASSGDGPFSFEFVTSFIPYPISRSIILAV